MDAFIGVLAAALFGDIHAAGISGRLARFTAGEDRVWPRCANAYLGLLAWLRQDIAACESAADNGAPPPFTPLPAELRDELAAFGSDQVDGQLKGYRRTPHWAAGGARRL